MKTVKIAKSNIDGYKHIYSLNNFSVPVRNNLYKYICFEQLAKSVQDKELIFVSPYKWKDPFERRFFKTDYSSLAFNRPEIACMCLTSRSTTNEEASWKMYVNANDKALRITFDFSVLCKILEDYAQHNDCSIFIGNVIYDFDKREIESLHKAEDTNINYKIFFPKNFDIEYYLTLMLLKRRSFAFENEVRIFIVKNGDLCQADGLLRIQDVDYIIQKLITQVMIAPYEPLPENDIRTPFRNKINNIESAEYKKILGDLLGCVIKQSQLYSNCIPLFKI